MSERLLKGRYELRSVLGRGRATTTHLALDHETGERRVVKLLLLSSAESLPAHERLMREARVLRRLDHPRIPRLFDFFSEEDGDDTRVCLVRQHLEGQSLPALVRGGRRFGEAEALALGVELARLLEYLHGFEPPILHGDVAPSNVVVGVGEPVGLVGFGAARDHVPHATLHPSGSAEAGTRGYASPEQIEGRAVPGSDLYALAATLVYVLSGRELAAGPARRVGLPASAAISPGLTRLVEWMLEPDWRERPLSASEAREELERLAREASRPRARPRPTRPWLFALAAVVALGALGIVLYARRGDPLRGSEASRSPARPLESARPSSPPPAPRGIGLAEQEPVPREASPEGSDVTAYVSLEERPDFAVYRFGGPLGSVQLLDLELGPGAVWVGTSRGLLRYDTETGGWRQWDEVAGLPGERLGEIAVAAGRVFADTATATGPGTARGTGVVAFEIGTGSIRAVEGLGSVWDLRGDGSTLWVGTGEGAEVRDLEQGTRRRFTRAAGELVHDSVHAVRRHGDTLVFASLGRWVKDRKDFEGGGVTLWDRRTDQFRSYTVADGLARGYSCDAFVDDDEVYVAHWDEERGLSRIDRRTGQVEVLRRSANGIDLGGVVLAGEPATLWIGQQGALVRLDRASRQATAFREKDGLPGYIVSGIAVARDAVWASLYSYGQGRVRSAGLVRFPRR